MSPAETRLGRNGVAEIKAHPFFAGVDWVRAITPRPSLRVVNALGAVLVADIGTLCC